MKIKAKCTNIVQTTANGSIVMQAEGIDKKAITIAVQFPDPKQAAAYEIDGEYCVEITILAMPARIE